MKSSGTGSLICCILCHFCSVMERSPCLTQEGNNLVHRMIFWNALCYIFALGITDFLLQWWLKIEFSSPSSPFIDLQPLKVSSYGEQSSLWLGCKSWRRHMIPIISFLLRESLHINFWQTWPQHSKLLIEKDYIQCEQCESWFHLSCTSLLQLLDDNNGRH